MKIAARRPGRIQLSVSRVGDAIADPGLTRPARSLRALWKITALDSNAVNFALFSCSTGSLVAALQVVGWSSPAAPLPCAAVRGPYPVKSWAEVRAMRTIP